MAIKQTFNYVSADPGTTIVNFVDWMNTLPANERTEAEAALTGFTIVENALVRANKLTIDFSSDRKAYIWASQEAADEGVPESAAWKSYHAKYLTDNNINLDITTETV